MGSEIRQGAVGPRRKLPLAIAALIFGGLAVCGLVNLWIEAPGDDSLPGIALGSQTLLVAERAVAFFAIWLLMLVVSAQAVKGRLPVEISGRGVRYADGGSTQESLAATKHALADLDRVTSDLLNRVATIENEIRAQHEC